MGIRRVSTIAIGVVVVATTLAAPARAQVGAISPTPTPELAAYDFLGGAVGFTHNGSVSGAEISGYWAHSFKEVVLSNPRPKPSLLFGAAAAASSGGSSAVQFVPGIVGEIGAIFSESTVTFAAGPRVTIVPPNSRFAPYGEFLIGGLHFSGDFSGTDLLTMPAFGAMIVVPHQKFLVNAEIGFPTDHLEGFHETDTRFLFGVTLPFGGS